MIIFKYMPIDNRVELSSYNPHHQNIQHESSTLMMEEEESFEKSVYYYQTIRCHLPNIGFEKGVFCFTPVRHGAKRQCK